MSRYCAGIFLLGLLLPSPSNAQVEPSVVILLSHQTPNPPLSNLPVITVTPNQIDQALAQCGTGCNLFFPAGTYDDVHITIPVAPLGISFYGEGAGQTTLRGKLHDPVDRLQPVFQLWQDPEGPVVIEHLTLDGRKPEQPVPLKPDGTLDHSGNGGVNSHAGLASYTPFLRDAKAGTIRHTEIKNFVGSCIELSRASDWTLEDNHIADCGCNQQFTACGTALVPNPWDSIPDTPIGPGTTAPGWKTAGFGIALNGVHNIRVLRNYITRASKSSISTYCQGDCLCSDLVFEDNTVEHSATGFTMNGGCRSRLSRNISRYHHVPGAEQMSLGKGFSAGADGKDAIYEGNQSYGNTGSGYAITSTRGDNLTFRDNSSYDNCRAGVGGHTAASFRGSYDPGGSTNLTIESYRSDDPMCYIGLSIAQYNQASVRNTSVRGGTLSGLYVSNSSDVQVESSTFSDHNEAVIFNWSRLENPMNNVYVQPSVVFHGTSGRPVVRTGQRASELDETVARCDVEPVSGCN